MKTKTMKTLVACIAAATILVTGCKKGDTGPVGANGANGVVPKSTDGYIKGTISGTRENGTIAFNETFNFQNYWGGYAATVDSVGSFAGSSYVFKIQRGTDYLGTDNASITVTVPTLTATTGAVSFNSLTVSQSLGGNKVFQFMTSGNPSTTATALSYNQSTGLFSGNFTFNLTGGQNSTGSAATITGSFQCTATQLYHFGKQTSPNQIAKD